MLTKIFNKKEKLRDNEINYINSFAKISRSNIIKKNNIVICAIYCKENNFIEEWLDYHLYKLNIIDHIYLYSNCNDDSHKIIMKYVKTGRVTLIKFDHIKKTGIGKINRKPQYFSLIHNFNNFREEYKYICTLI